MLHKVQVRPNIWSFAVLLGNPNTSRRVHMEIGVCVTNEAILELARRMLKKAYQREMEKESYLI